MENQKILFIKSIILYGLIRIIVIVIPIKKNRYFCISMNGNSYGDNVKCLSDSIINTKSNAEIIWAFAKGFNPNIKSKEKKVRLFTLKYYYYILTSKYILNNGSLGLIHLIKRKGQVCINTWHGTALKRIGIDIFSTQKQGILYRFFNFNYVKYNSEVTDIFLSGSRFMTDIIRNKLLFDKDIYEIGTPRNDIFFHNRADIVEKVRKYYNISEGKKIILYAPTFRVDKSFIWYDVDLKKIKKEIENKYGGNYDLMVRLHPSLIYKDQEFSALFPNDVINVSLYPDMQELLYTVDVLITDYSSSMFDFMYTERLVILYVPDRKIYNRGYYINIDSLPFIILNNNAEIHEKIQNFNMIIYKDDIQRFIKSIGSVEDGKASISLLNILDNYDSDSDSDSD